MLLPLSVKMVCLPDKKMPPLRDTDANSGCRLQTGKAKTGRRGENKLRIRQ